MTGPTNNLAGDPIADEMESGQHLAVNTRVGYIDGAITNPLEVLIDDSNARLLNALEFATNASFFISDAATPPTADITLTVPDLNDKDETMYRGNFNVFNSASFPVVVEKTGGQTLPSPTIYPGEKAVLHFDGSNVEYYRPSGVVLPFDRGTISTGTESPSPTDGQMQIAENGGAHSFAAPTITGSFVITYVNGAAAGEITPVGWSVVTDPDGALSHTVEGSIIRCTVYYDGLASELLVALIVDATPLSVPVANLSVAPQTPSVS